ncbi:MAG: PH domain-containing protein [Verrucomicrobiales bacterium]
MTQDEITRLERPSSGLLTLYILRAVLTGPGVILVLPMLLCRYWTLRYRFDDDGIHARWGVLFRREINLSYARIQDLHLTSGLLQRWLGLADVQVQTASGSATPELIIEGFKNHEAIRDFLYSRMRGTKTGKHSATRPTATTGDSVSGLDSPDPVAVNLAVSLREVAAALRATRDSLDRLKPSAAPSLPSL